MNEKYAYLPCNGLDKPAGPLTRELALELVSATGGDLICPVLLGRSRARYATVLDASPLFAIDCCATRCASRLAADQGLAVARKVQLTEALKTAGQEAEDSLTPGPRGLAFVGEMVARLLAEPAGSVQAESSAGFEEPVVYLSFVHDKFVFRVPAEGYLFNENDCWARLNGTVARLGISDYMQQNLSDILFFNPPAVGAQVEQFGEAGTVESDKATFEVVAPVSGRVRAVNQVAADAPELINEDPYERGWLVEVELEDLVADRELLLEGGQYLDLVKRKAAEFRG